MISRRLESMLLHEAPDPSRSRKLLLERVEAGAAWTRLHATQPANRGGTLNDDTIEEAAVVFTLQAEENAISKVVPKFRHLLRIENPNGAVAGVQDAGRGVLGEVFHVVVDAGPARGGGTGYGRSNQHGTMAREVAARRDGRSRRVKAKGWNVRAGMDMVKAASGLAKACIRFMRTLLGKRTRRAGTPRRQPSTRRMGASRKPGTMTLAARSMAGSARGSPGHAARACCRTRPWPQGRLRRPASIRQSKWQCSPSPPCGGGSLPFRPVHSSWHQLRPERRQCPGSRRGGPRARPPPRRSVIQHSSGLLRNRDCDARSKMVVREGLARASNLVGMRETSGCRGPSRVERDGLGSVPSSGGTSGLRAGRPVLPAH